MVVYAYFDSFVVHFQRFAERARLAHQHATSLSQGTIDGFDDAGLATALWTSLMGCRWQHLRVGSPHIRQIARIFLKFRW